MGDSNDSDEVINFVKGTRVKLTGLTTFSKGEQVRVTGLSAEEQLNGKLGTITGYDVKRDRWVVDLGDAFGKKMFRSSANLRVEQASERENPQPSEATYKAELAPSPPNAAAVGGGDDDNCDEVINFFKGARVRITGLLANAGLNDKCGVIERFDEAKKRWIVALEDGLGRKLFREANLAAVTGSAGSGRSAGAEVPLPKPENLGSLSKGPQPFGLAATQQPRAAPAAPTPPSKSRPSLGSEPGRFRPGSQVLVEGLEEEDCMHLNGQIGTCEMCDYLSGHWHVRFAPGDVRRIRPQHLTWQPAMLRPGAYIRVRNVPGAPELNGELGICESLDAERLLWRVCLASGGQKSLKSENLVPQDGERERTQFEPEEDSKFASTLEMALASGEISWLDC